MARISFAKEFQLAQGRASFEGVVAEFLESGGEADSAELGAGPEGVEADGTHAWGDFEFPQGCAIRECAVADAAEAPGQGEGFQIDAPMECPIADFLDAFGDLQRTDESGRAGAEGFAIAREEAKRLWMEVS